MTDEESRLVDAAYDDLKKLIARLELLANRKVVEGRGRAEIMGGVEKLWLAAGLLRDAR